MMRRPRFGLVWPAVMLMAGCETAGQQRVLGIEATGVINGLAYLDADRSRRFDAGDTPVPALRVHLIPWGTIDTARRLTSNASGVLNVAGLPVGRYDILVDSTSGGDSLVVVRVDTSTLNLGPNDTVSLSVGLSFPLVSVAAARTSPAGRKVFIEAVSLTGSGAFSDTTAHVLAGTGALRLVRVGSGLFGAGDSVRVRGTTSVRDGQPVLRDVTFFPLGVGSLPPTDSISTTDAAAAKGGSLDAALVRAGGMLKDSSTVSGNLVLRVDDGSGTVRILLDQRITFPLGLYAVEGARVRASGVLVPVGPGEWYLKPRTATDLRVDIDVLTPAQVRQRAVGQRVFVDGVALNRPNLFGDSTLHLADAGSAIRIIESVNPNIFPGDRIRVAGAVATRAGQVVVKGPIIFTLSTGGLVVFRTVTTAEAASAASGVLDAAYVRVVGTIKSRAPGTGGDLRAVVDDGSGPVTVLLDGDLGLNTDTTRWVADSAADVRGLLVPEGSLWELKPRIASDVQRP